MPLKLSHPPYKGASNAWLTRTLFVEQVQRFPAESAYEPIFSFTGLDGYIDARRTFLALRDPTGYLWAIKYLASWEHFERLLTCSWFESEYQSWLRELKMILRQEALAVIQEIAQEGTQQSFAAAKYLASAEWEKPLRGRGAPSKAELKGELAQAVKQLTVYEEDAQRMGLTVIQGGKN